MDGTLTHLSTDGRAVHPGEAMSAAEAVEARRLRRLALVGRLMEAGEEAAMNLTEGMAGRLAEDRREAYERIKDPALAWSRIVRGVQQLAALEELFDEDAAKRTERIAADRARLEETARAIAADQALTPTKNLVQETVREIYRDADQNMPSFRRERLLRDLFTDFAATDDYTGDPIGIVVRMMRNAYLTDEEGSTRDIDLEVTPDLALAYLNDIRAAAGLPPVDRSPPDG